MGHQYTWNISPPLTTSEKQVPSFITSAFVQRLYRRRFQGTQALMPEIYALGSLEDLREPYDIPELMEGAQCLANHLEQHHPIAIFCDYDVDGICGGTLLRQFILETNPAVSVSVFQSNRMLEGYGLSMHHVDRLSDFACIITVDCGSGSIDPIQKLSDAGCDVIVTDHHECAYDQEGKVICPNTAAFINPKRPDNPHYFNFISGTGVVFMLCLALRKFSAKCAQVKLSPYLDLVCTSIISDSVPLINENRIFVRYGLQLFNTTPKPFLKKLLDHTMRYGPIDESTLSFSLIPKMNAPGRMGDATPILQGLISRQTEDIERYYQETIQKNEERMKIQHKSWKRVEVLAEEQTNSNVICVYHPDIHEGVLGILASRLCEKYHKPAIVLAKSKIAGEIRGSGRAPANGSILSIIQSVSEHFSRFGGHQAAVGLTLHESNLQPLQDKLEQTKFSPKPPTLNIDEEIRIQDLTVEAAQELESLGPFGQGFPVPLFLIRNVRIPQLRLLKEEHLKGVMDQGNPSTPIELIAWKGGALAPYIRGSTRYSVVVRIKLNHYQNRKTVQCELVDIEKE